MVTWHIYEHQGKYREAEKLCEKSLRISERILGEKHPDTATSYNNLAFSYKSRKKYQIALDYFMKAYKVFMTVLGTNHPDTKAAYKNMKVVYSEWNPEGSFKQWLEEKKKE